MSQRDITVPGGGTGRLVDATGANETVYLPRGFAVGRPFTVRRVDNSAFTVTVVPPSGESLDGVVDATTNVGGNNERGFLLRDPLLWESFGGIPGAEVASDPALIAAFAKQRQPIGHAVIGDSITAFQSVYGQSWHRQIVQLSGQSVRYRADPGTGGYTLEQGESVHLPTVLALNPRPEICTIALGTNNVGAVGYSFTTSKATHARIRATLEAAGIMPGLWTLPPRDDSTTVNGYVQEWNAWIWELHRAYGYPVIDAHSALVDPTTGLYKSTLKLDDVHPNRLGHLRIAQQALGDPRFTGRFTRNGTPHLSTSVLEASNLFPGGGVFAVDTNADGLSDGLSKIGTPTLTRGAAPYGQWQRMSVASGVPNSGIVRATVATGVTAGRTYEVSCRMHVDLDPATITNVASYGISARDNSNVEQAYFWMADVAAVLDTTVVGHRRFVAPANCTRFWMDLSLAGTPTRDTYAEISQVLVRDVTDLAA